MEAMRRLFGYLKNYAKLGITYDPRIPDFSTYDVTHYDWFRCYPGVQEELPPDMPEARGNGVRICGFFDASHASCLQTRRSVTGILLFLNNTPIMWYSKRQATVETSTYGSELVAGRIVCELAIDLRYRMRMLGVPILGSCLLFGDNQSMITNVTIPGSSLKKRSLAIAYHRVRECIAAGIIDMVHCRSEHNLADLMTKSLGPMVFQRLLHNIKFPPTAHEVTDTGELKEKSETNEKMTSHRVVIEYPFPMNDFHCPMTELAESLKSSYLIL